MNIKTITHSYLAVLLVLAMFFNTGCKLFEKQTDEEAYDAEDEYYEYGLEETVLGEEEEEEIPPYRPSRKRVNDLLHTKLEVSFNFEKQYLIGKAYLTLKPYFYPTNSLTLDAKGFDINTIRLNNRNGDTLAYSYDGKQLHITLNKTYSREQQYVVYIDYVAKPNELPEADKGHGHAITADKGLYFIDPLGEDPSKPTQVWTQGETESSSCWFPTIDSPNEKTAQEIFITVDNKYVTLSNGELVYRRKNANGTRTDYWRQNLPHSPYLFMMAVGEFAMIKDKWNDMEVNYYVEPEYAQYAKEIFGNTPEMIGFYSNILGVTYPWDKYSQVVVRDFVSGAMENTGAVIHGSFLQRTSRQLLDEDYEEVIAHELFHHWFGDMVTCESWANLPLNESFATYGEYLWIDYKYGKMQADYHIYQDLGDYLLSAKYEQKQMIRYRHATPDEMFDTHSYQKGGRILHMLRNYIGDEAFFMGLKTYLENFKFNNAEIHDLRLIYEKITGEDLNWFFNQWFLNSGHPKLDIVHDYDEINKIYTLKVYQREDNYFRLPVKVEIYNNGKSKVNEIEVLPQEYNEFTFAVTSQPDWVNFDADKILVCEKVEERDDAQWIYQFNNGKNYVDKIETLKKLPYFAERRKESAKVLIYNALNDDFWNIREEAIELLSEIEFLGDELNTNIIDKVKELAVKDPKSSVRMAAILFLDEKENEAYASIYQKATGDSSYDVLGVALRAYARVDKEAALKIGEEFLTSNDVILKREVIGTVSRYGTGNYLNHFDTLFSTATSMNVISLIFDYSVYLKKADPFVQIKGLDLVDKYNKLWGGKGLTGIVFAGMYNGIKMDAEKELKKVEEQLELTSVDTEISELNNKRENLIKVIEICANRLEDF